MKRLEADCLSILGQVLTDAGELEAAREAKAEGERLYREVRDPETPFSMEITIASIEREEGKLASGEARVRAAIAGLEKLPSDKNVAEDIRWARSVLADLLAAAGRVSEAQQEMERVLATADWVAGQSLRARDAKTLIQARVEAAQGHVEVARRLVAGVYTEAHGAGMVTIELEARLLQLVLATPDQRAKRSYRQLATELRDEAARRGFGLIEKKAAALLRNQGPAAQSRFSRDQ
jgi:hypothetical protein